MADKDTRYEDAKRLYIKLRQAEGYVKTHTKLLIALPKHKVKKHQQLLADANVGLFNVRNAFNQATRKLTMDELLKLQKELSI